MLIFFFHDVAAENIAKVHAMQGFFFTPAPLPHSGGYSSLISLPILSLNFYLESFFF